MKALLVTIISAVLCYGSSLAATPTGEWFGQLGLGTVGGLAGAVVAVTAIAEIAPQIESHFGKTAVVIGSLTVFDGLGAGRQVYWPLARSGISPATPEDAFSADWQEAWLARSLSHCYTCSASPKAGQNSLAWLFSLYYLL